MLAFNNIMLAPVLALVALMSIETTVEGAHHIIPQVSSVLLILVAGRGIAERAPRWGMAVLAGTLWSARHSSTRPAAPPTGNEFMLFRFNVLLAAAVLRRSCLW